MMWTTVVSERKEMCNAPSAIEHIAFVSGAVADMLAARAVILSPRCENLMVVSPLGMVPKPHTKKYRLTVILR